jgi:hypothetical protein
MAHTNYRLKELCRHNRDGSYATQTNRERMLALPDHLRALGFRGMNARSLKPKHVEALIERWQWATPFHRTDQVRMRYVPSGLRCCQPRPRRGGPPRVATRRRTAISAIGP